MEFNPNNEYNREVKVNEECDDLHKLWQLF